MIRHFQDPLVYLLLAGSLCRWPLGWNKAARLAYRRGGDSRDRGSHAVLEYVQRARADSAMAELQKMTASGPFGGTDGRSHHQLVLIG